MSLLLKFIGFVLYNNKYLFIFTMAKKSKSFIIKVLIVIIAIAGIRFYQQYGLSSGVAPEFLSKSITGVGIGVTSELPEATIVRFWATWCGICALEHDNFESLSRSGAPLLNIAWQSGTDDLLLEYAKKNQINPVNIINDKTGTIAALYGVKATPTTFIISRAGKIIFTEVGYTTTLGLQLRLWWTNLIG